MRRRSLLVPALAAAALLVLAGCSAGTDDSGEVTVEPDELPVDSGSGALHDCLVGTWQLDTAKNAQQLQENFAANGTEITSTTADGSVVLTVDDANMSFDSGITYTMSGTVADVDLVVTQHQVGVSEGRWSETDGVVSFFDWVPGTAVTNKVTVAGTETDLGVEFPEDFGAGSPLDVYCSGDALETTPQESPFTGYWARIG